MADRSAHHVLCESVAVIEFFFDIGSSYSYLAATQMEGVAKRTGVPVQWRPFLQYVTSARA